ncbi:Lrp/AsnC family transcriptional regulator [Actinomadura decatromicini]|uniref:Lrp/AsnC family transcriptional regulator n=1 Tax=Actinomadura decatromicini TaxID=2604572 RepID=A0A5D3F6V5_9ACTN|nr:Lrp/AsnC family transcriptional regulator [Actinomadura decatromicini]TYK43075.1 Lrp/AsnC family transcriptional regulator [Actinomadura decatromicini]
MEEAAVHAERDDIDEKVIARLVDDARTTYADIGDELGLSAPAVKRRVDRLREVGVIRGFTAVVDLDVLGWRTEVFVEIYCAGKISSDDILSTLERHPEIADLCTVVGEPDAIVRLLAADTQHLEAALERIRSEPLVLRTRSTVVLSRLLERPRA